MRIVAHRLDGVDFVMQLAVFVMPKIDGENTNQSFLFYKFYQIHKSVHQKETIFIDFM